MPKKIVTKSTLPKILRVLDQWEGKLTWDAYCDRVAQALGIDSVSRMRCSIILQSRNTTGVGSRS